MIITLPVNRFLMNHHGSHPMTNCAFIIIEGYEDAQQVGDIFYERDSMLYNIFAYHLT